MKLFMVQGARLSSLIKKLVKVNMSSTFLGLSKAKKLKEFLLKINNYYDDQRASKNKVSIVVN